jgi:hypothetical protein
MSAFKKIAGLVAGASAVAVLGVAVAQGVPPNPFVSNLTQGAGQQSSHLTPMGETGTPWGAARVETAQITPVQEVPVAQAEPAPAPAPQETQSMGAAPEPAPAPVAKADRN